MAKTSKKSGDNQHAEAKKLTGVSNEEMAINGSGGIRKRGVAAPAVVLTTPAVCIEASGGREEKRRNERAHQHVVVDSACSPTLPAPFVAV